VAWQSQFHGGTGFARAGCDRFGWRAAPGDLLILY
jgi:hypothetical protein